MQGAPGDNQRPRLALGLAGSLFVVAALVGTWWAVDFLEELERDPAQPVPTLSRCGSRTPPPTAQLTAPLP